MLSLGKDMVAASATPLVLSLLQRSESYGYQLIADIRTLSGGGIEWSEGMLYPVLRRLEAKGLIASRWHQASNERKRRYYRLTAKGKRELELEKERWGLVTASLQALWSAHA